MKCKLCGAKVTEKNNGLLNNLLNSEERARFLNLNKNQTICLGCKKELLYLQILSPYK